MSFDVAQYLSSLSRFGIKPGLERIKALLAHLGQPHKAYKTVHIGGTNGKGSIAAATASILQAAGYRVGLYTSPHLIRYNERIRVDGREISDDDLAHWMREVSVAAANVTADLGTDPTEFEIGTAVAFRYFQECDVDVAVVEVGLGGRLDSTNVLDSSAVALAGISLDHTNVLGDTLQAITREKTGIFKPGQAVVVAPQDPIAENEILKRATELGCSLTLVRDKRGSDQAHPTPQISYFTPISWTLDGGVFDLETPWGPLVGCRTPLLGYHQIENAATAVTLSLSLKQRGFDITESSIVRGLQQTQWPGRLQLIAGQPRMLLDGVHNHGGAKSLAHALQSLFRGERIVLLMAILAEKDADNILKTLLPLGEGVVFTEPQKSRIPATSPDVLVEKARHLGYRAQSAPDLSTALAQATEIAGPDGIVCVCGSLYLVGEMLARRDKENDLTLP